MTARIGVPASAWRSARRQGEARGGDRSAVPGQTGARTPSGGSRVAVACAAVLLLACAAAAPRAAADEAAQAALERARVLNHGERHWTDRRQRMQLTIVDRRGTEYARDLEVVSKRYEGDAVRSLMFFHGPKQVRGIGFLQWTDPRAEDHQWLWLPALKRVRQISGGARSESFVGTDFSYEDLAVMAEAVDWRDEQAASSRLGEEAVDGVLCDVIELRPTEQLDSDYGSVRLWLARDDLTVRKFEFRDDDGTLRKTLLLSDVRAERDIPTAHRLEMRNEKSGSRTTVVVSELDYDRGIGDEEFTQRRLEKGL